MKSITKKNVVKEKDSGKDKYEEFLKAFRESKGSILIACQKSGLSQQDAFVFMAELGKETNKDKLTDPKNLIDSGTKEERIYNLLNRMQEKDMNDDTYLKYSQEYSKLMGHYDNTADVGMLEAMQEMYNKIEKLFTPQIMAHIAYDIEDIEEIDGGIIVEDDITDEREAAN
jgi:hypothetical protein